MGVSVGTGVFDGTGVKLGSGARVGREVRVGGRGWKAVGEGAAFGVTST
jgi:hypothetical protein